MVKSNGAMSNRLSFDSSGTHTIQPNSDSHHSVITLDTDYNNARISIPTTGGGVYYGWYYLNGSLANQLGTYSFSNLIDLRSGPGGQYQYYTLSSSDVVDLYITETNTPPVPDPTATPEPATPNPTPTPSPSPTSTVAPTGYTTTVNISTVQDFTPSLTGLTLWYTEVSESYSLTQNQYDDTLNWIEVGTYNPIADCSQGNGSSNPLSITVSTPVDGITNFVYVITQYRDSNGTVIYGSRYTSMCNWNWQQEYHLRFGLQRGISGNTVHDRQDSIYPDTLSIVTPTSTPTATPTPTPTSTVAPTPTPTATVEPVSCISAAPLNINVETEYDSNTNTTDRKYITSDLDGNGGLFGCINVNRGSTVIINVTGSAPDLETHPIKITNFNGLDQHEAPLPNVVSTWNAGDPYTLTWEVPCDVGITQYQYQCVNHAGMRGVINVSGTCPTPTPNPTSTPNATPNPTPANNTIYVHTP